MYEVERVRRRSLRLPAYDYAQAGAYFITICTRNRERVLGEVVDGRMRPNEFGDLAGHTWEGLPRHYPGVRLDAWVVMPNHLHGILMLDDAGSERVQRVDSIPDHTGVRGEEVVGGAPRAGLKPAPTSRHGVPEIVRGFKTFSARRINVLRGTVGVPFWQRGYFEHVVRDQSGLDRIRRYIEENPLRWDIDPENPQVE